VDPTRRSLLKAGAAAAAAGMAAARVKVSGAAGCGDGILGRGVPPEGGRRISGTRFRRVRLPEPGAQRRGRGALRYPLVEIVQAG